MPETLALDLISDLNLSSTEGFDWSDKPTSLFCIVAGGITSDMTVLDQIFAKLSNVYRGVFYIDGAKEHKELQNVESTVLDITNICKKYNNVVYLHNHVVILNNVAFVGINGWYKTVIDQQLLDKSSIESLRMQDLAYLNSTIKTLKSHSDVKKILVISACVPAEDFTYQHIFDGQTKIEPAMALFNDDENLVKTWAFGGLDISVDTTYNDRRFVNNPCTPGQPYWPKRIVV